jgi:ABC-type multidrug transport system ATPase subunit
MEDARRCDQVGFLQSGNFIAIGAPDDLTSATGNENANLEDAFLYFMNKDNS